MSDVDAPAISLMDGTFWARPHDEELAWLRANSPVHFDGEVWGISRHADVKAISVEPEIFSNAGGIRPDVDPLPFLIDKDDPEHMVRRRLVNRWFTPRRITEMEPRITELCHSILDEVCERGECDLVMDVCAWLPLHVIGDMVGFPMADRPTLLQWSDDMMRAVGAVDETLLLRGGEAMAGFMEFALTAVEERRSHPGDDLLSVLVGAEDADAPADQIVHDALALLVAGDETTRHVLSGGMHELLRDPTQRDRLAADPTLIPTAVEEMLRWVSPIKNMNRTATRDVEVHGHTIHEGDNVLLLYESANRDEDVFADPYSFDIARHPNDHLAFGVGPHFCLGAALARQEMACFLEVVFERLPGLELASDQLPPTRISNFVTGFEHLPVRYEPSLPRR